MHFADRPVRLVAWNVGYHQDDAWKIDAINQWCLRRLIVIKWYQFVSNAEV